MTETDFPALIRRVCERVGWEWWTENGPIKSEPYQTPIKEPLRRDCLDDAFAVALKAVVLEIRFVNRHDKKKCLIFHLMEWYESEAENAAEALWLAMDKALEGKGANNDL